jgi:predicted metal-binding protein
MARHGTGAYDPYISRVAIIGDGGSSNRRLPGRRRCIARIWLSGGAEEICQASSSTRTAVAPGCGYETTSEENALGTERRNQASVLRSEAIRR